MTDYGLSPIPTHAPQYEKDASDTIDYSQSWHQLGTDTILTSEWESDALEVGTSTVLGLVTNVTVSGGTAGAVARLTNTITTGMGRTLQRSIYVAVCDL